MLTVSSVIWPAGAKVAVCELPFGYISSDSVGGAGGTCVLRGCVPKKLVVYASSFTQEFAESRGFGCALISLTTIPSATARSKPAVSCSSSVWMAGA